MKKEKLPIEFHLQSVDVKKPGNLILESFDIVTFPNLVDYVQDGLKMKLILGIDFTADNLTHISWESLHFRGKEEDLKSPYQEVIDSIWQVIDEYNPK